jgi:1-acyl-sn-glycerol-3-phosphate acyltransferase
MDSKEAAPNRITRLLNQRNPTVIKSLMPLLAWLYRYYFRVQTSGWHHVPLQENMLVVGTHNGGLAAPDLGMFIYDWFRHVGYDRRIYGLMHPKVWEMSPATAQSAARLGAIPACSRVAIAALQSGASVLVYPGGAQDVFRPHRMRHQIYFANRVGFIKLAIREAVPILPIISWGAHDTLFVLEDCYQQVQWLNQLGMPWLMNIDPEVFPIYLGLPWGIAIGPLPNIPLPAKIHTRVCAPIWFERYGREALRDQAYLNDCYARVVQEMQLALNQLIADCS